MQEVMNILWGVFVFGALFVIVDQISTHWKKGKLPGPMTYFPLFGGIVEMVMDPTSFWLRQDGYGPVSWNYLLGKMMIHTTDPELSRKVLSSDNPDQLKMKVHPNAELIFGKHNMAFMQGPAHKQLRQQLLPLFTRKALSHYVFLQDDITRKHMEEWVTKGEKMGKGGEREFVQFRPLARDLNTMTSQKVFVGPYLTEPQMEEFGELYQRMNEGFLSFPLNFPGSTLNKAVKAREQIVQVLEKVVSKSRERMSQSDAEPLCLLDFWMEKTVKALQEYQEKRERGEQGEYPPHSSDKEMALTVLDFLFASQDASTSSLIWTVHFMSNHPEILEKVRKEQDELRPNDEPVTHDLILKMTYTKRVVKEILRIRPPATLVPQEAQKDYQLTDGVIVPRGSLITPSLWAASYYGYSNPYAFDPDRFSPERGEEEKHSKSFLVFGAGPHTCLGREYALNHLMTFLSLLAGNLDWERKKTKETEKILFGPTIYPQDCLVSLRKRVKEGSI